MAGYLKRALGAAILAGVLAFGVAGAAWAKVELSMYYPVAVGGPLTKIVDGLVADFMKENPDIDVKAIYAGNYNDARIKALAALKSGQPAQLSVMFAIDIYELIEQDAIVAFDDIVETDEEKAWLTKFYPALMENGITGGKTWGIPFQRSTIVMYYNKDAFRDAGLDPENPPATWDELVDAGQKLVKKDASGQIERWGIMIPSTGYPYWMFGALAMQNDQVLMNSAGNETFFDAPSTVGALEFWLDLGKTHKVMPQGTIEWGTLRQNFLEQKTAIMWHSTGNLTVVKGKAEFDFGVAMLPAAAMKLIRFLTEPERTAEWSMKTGYLGTRPDAYETQALMDYVGGFPPAAVARDQLDYATAELSTYQTGRVRKLLDDAIQAALTGAKSPGDALGAAQKQSDRLLEQYR
jgi:sn-glycerol 3-phosphate transport system substrate-binding protein